jgi:uncharacterized membrane protein YdjX (TVP38/TMEM64 family)
LLVSVALLSLAYWSWAELRAALNRSLDILAAADIEQLREFLLSFGLWAPVVSAALMVLQSVLFPLPAFIITVTNGLLFGTFWGTVLSWSSAMVGAAVCYGIGRILGRPTVERLVSPKALTIADRFFDRYGKHAVLIARLIPVLSFDVVSYAAGVTSLNFVEFMVATGIGQLPATIVYSYLGQNITKNAEFGLWAAMGVAALLVLALAVKKALENRIVDSRAC